MNEKVVFFTIVARNYLSQAFVLGNSVKNYHPESSFKIFLIDDLARSHEKEISQRGFSAIYPEQIEIRNYMQFVFLYNVLEACTAVKPFVMKYIFSEGAEKVIYLDPDILCYRRFDELLEMLSQSGIVITPHSVSPHSDGYFPPDRYFLASGAYNLGFIAVSKGKMAFQFLQWWANHLSRHCLVSAPLSLFVDQKWIDLVPSYFEDVYILKSLAYNIAYWNLHERSLKKDKGIYYVEQSGEPIAFIHFSGLIVKDLKRISRFIPENNRDGSEYSKLYSLQNRPDLIEPFNDYVNLLVANGYQHYSSLPYTFEKYSNGEPISQLERTLFRISSKWQKKSINPFEVEGDSFWKFCRKLRIKPSKWINRKIGSLFIRGPMIIFVRSIIRVLIKIIGVNAYLIFAEYCTWQFQLTNHDFLMKEKRQS